MKKKSPPALADADGPEEKWDIEPPACISAPERSPPEFFIALELIKRGSSRLRERGDVIE